jgi:hypothetical protein
VGHLDRPGQFSESEPRRFSSSVISAQSLAASIAKAALGRASPSSFARSAASRLSSISLARQYGPG